MLISLVEVFLPHTFISSAIAVGPILHMVYGPAVRRAAVAIYLPLLMAIIISIYKPENYYTYSLKYVRV